MADVRTTGTGINCLYHMLLCLVLDVCIFLEKSSEITKILVNLKNCVDTTYKLCDYNIYHGIFSYILHNQYKFE